MKLRPVLVLSAVTGPSAEILVSYVSSVIPADLLPSDVVIDPRPAADQATRLKTVSIVRLHKLATTIHRTSLMRYLGELSTPRLDDAKGRLRSCFGM